MPRDSRDPPPKDRLELRVGARTRRGERVHRVGERELLATQARHEAAAAQRRRAPRASGRRHADRAREAGATPGREVAEDDAVAAEVAGGRGARGPPDSAPRRASPERSLPSARPEAATSTLRPASRRAHAWRSVSSGARRGRQRPPRAPRPRRAAAQPGRARRPAKPSHVTSPRRHELPERLLDLACGGAADARELGEERARRRASRSEHAPRGAISPSGGAPRRAARGATAGPAQRERQRRARAGGAPFARAGRPRCGAGASGPRRPRPTRQSSSSQRR